MRETEGWRRGGFVDGVGLCDAKGEGNIDWMV